MNSTASIYHDGSRKIQEKFGTRKLADRVAEKLVRNSFTDEDRAFIESRSFFFLSAADAEGRPDCSHKGGLSGFVRVVDSHTLAFPDYDGNGMFKSLGNITENPYVGLLFIDFELQTRVRVNGRAELHKEDPLLSEFAGAQLIVRINLDFVFPNCGRYVHRMLTIKQSIDVPRENYTPRVAKWKLAAEFRDVLPPGEQPGPPVANTWRLRASCAMKAWLKKRIASTLLRLRR